jgi:hypothetical protein
VNLQFIEAFQLVLMVLLCQEVTCQAFSAGGKGLFQQQ